MNDNLQRVITALTSLEIKERNLESRRRKTYRDCGKIIHAERIARGLSLTEVARRCGFHKSFMHCIETGKRGWTLALAKKVIDGLEGKK
jgi:ribosome-binding protein aMBF1 (putative translation factor)